MEENTVLLPHMLLIENRNRITVKGVTDVHTFNEETILLETGVGGLTLNGENLQVTSLSLESGDVSIEGKINTVQYSDGIKRNGGLFSKVFG